MASKQQAAWFQQLGSHDILDTLADMNAVTIKRYFLNSVTVQPLLRDSSKLPRGKRTQEAFHEAQHNVPVVFWIES